MPRKTRHSVNKNKVLCRQCNLQVLDNEDAIQCDACEKTLHSLCTKLDKRQYEKLVKNTSIEYKCHLCINNNEESSVSADLLEIKTKLKQLDQLDEITTTIQFMSSQYDSILKGVAANKKKIDCLQKENELLREEVCYLKSSVKYLNDDRVKNDCIINGVMESDGNKQAIDVVLDIAGKIGADISTGQVDDAYFLPSRKNTNSNNNKDEKKSIVVKFASKIQKHKFMAGKSKLKENDSLKTTYINDFLCKESMELLNHAKSIKAVGYKYVWTRDSKIFVKKDEKSRAVFIRNMDDVDKILLRSSQGAASNSRRRTFAKVDDNSSEGEEEDAFRSPN